MFKRIALIAATACTFIITPALAATFTAEQKNEIRQLIAEYLAQHPSNTPANDTDQTAANETMTQQPALLRYRDALFNDTMSPTVGAKSPKAYLVEFFDYQCGHCQAMRPVLESILHQNPEVKLVLKALPMFGPQSRFAALAGMAAMRQGKYWLFHQAMLAPSQGLPPGTVLDIARRLGINVPLMQKNMQRPEILQQLQKNEDLADKLSVTGAPTIFLADGSLSHFEVIPGSVTVKNLRRSIAEVEYAAKH